ncbi:MAG TPA: hypothetical protein VK599_11880 [Streptosporangiaceae bacterium]|nr:hypothetical protein [Streptosporangiaceae bacterium]
MATAALPAGRRSLLGKLFVVIGIAISRNPAAKKRAEAFTAGVREHFVTVVALGCADYAAFIHSPFAGWLVLAGCLFLLDLKIQG